MARPRTDLLSRIEAKIDRTSCEPHYLWLGSMHRARPFLSHYGNPVRALLAINNNRIAIRPDCSVKNCVNPYHWKTYVEQSHKYGDTAKPVDWQDPRVLPTGLTAMQQEMVAADVASIRSGEVTLEETLEYISDPTMISEIKRQLAA